MTPATASCATCWNHMDGRRSLFHKLEVGAAKVEGRNRNRFAAVGLIDSEWPLLDRMAAGVERDDPEFGGAAAIDALEPWIGQQRGLQLFAAVDVATLGQHPADQLPDCERVFIIVGGIDLGLQVELLDVAVEKQLRPGIGRPGRIEPVGRKHVLSKADPATSPASAMYSEPITG